MCRKTLNILLTREDTAKLADVGLSRSLQLATHQSLNTIKGDHMALNITNISLTGPWHAQMCEMALAVLLHSYDAFLLHHPSQHEA